MLPELCSNPKCLSSEKLLASHTIGKQRLEIEEGQYITYFHRRKEFVFNKICNFVKNDKIMTGYFYKIDRIGNLYYAMYKYPDGKIRRHRII